MFIFWKPCDMTGCPYLLVPIEKCVTKMHPWHPSHVWGAMAGWRAFETTSFSSSTSISVGSVVLRLCKIMFEIWDHSWHSWLDFGQGSRKFDLKLLENLDHFTPFLPQSTTPHGWFEWCLDGRTLIVSNADAWCQYGIKPSVWKYKMLPCHIFGYFGDKPYPSISFSG